MNGKRKGWFKKKGGVDLLTGLISCWELDETSGTNVADANSLHDGTNVNVTVNQTGKIDKAYLFDATGDYITVPDHNDFSMTDGANDLPFSISCWINLNSLASNSYFINKGNTSGKYEWWFRYGTADTSIKVGLLNTTASIGILSEVENVDSGLTTNTWYHLAVTYDGSESETGINIYFDGQLLTQRRYIVGSYTGMTNGTDNLIIGNNSPTGISYIHGLQDQTAIWKNRELTQTEVTALYNAGSGLAYTSWT